jgi:deoxyribodipyrimidine photolyase-related protein
MRRATGWLMSRGKPIGGSWNFDRENRKALPKRIKLPEPPRFAPDAETQAVLSLVEARFADHFGDLHSFEWAVTREQALAALEHFVDACLPRFGDYQDAMKSGSESLFHSVISPYLNIGLLDPREVCLAALAAFEKGAAPLPAVEGFVRQILGWREFVRGIYWLKAPDYGRSNFFEAHRALPGFFWTAETEMNCLRQTIETTQRRAYAHHIQRLMITGNFALLAGIEPAQVEEWYLIVYADAFEWVELPNTHGMALFADGGLLGSKPYAASGSYINRMSDYCAGCCYDPKVRLGDKACPFNFLYWNFLIAQRSRLARNPRMAIIYRVLDRIPAADQRKITSQANEFLEANGIV